MGNSWFLLHSRALLERRTACQAGQAPSKQREGPGRVTGPRGHRGQWEIRSRALRGARLRRWRLLRTPPAPKCTPPIWRGSEGPRHPRPGQALLSPCGPWPRPLMKLKAEDPHSLPPSPVAQGLPRSSPRCTGTRSPSRAARVPNCSYHSPAGLLLRPAARAGAPWSGAQALARVLRGGPGRSSSRARLAGGAGFPARRLGRRQNRRRGAGRAKPSDWSDGGGAGPARRAGASCKICGVPDGPAAGAWSLAPVSSSSPETSRNLRRVHGPEPGPNPSPSKPIL